MTALTLRAHEARTLAKTGKLFKTWPCVFPKDWTEIADIRKTGIGSFVFQPRYGHRMLEIECPIRPGEAECLEPVVQDLNFGGYMRLIDFEASHPQSRENIRHLPLGDMGDLSPRIVTVSAPAPFRVSTITEEQAEGAGYDMAQCEQVFEKAAMGAKLLPGCYIDYDRSGDAPQDFSDDEFCHDCAEEIVSKMAEPDKWYIGDMTCGEVEHPSWCAKCGAQLDVGALLYYGWQSHFECNSGPESWREFALVKDSEAAWLARQACNCENEFLGKLAVSGFVTNWQANNPGRDPETAWAWGAWVEVVK